MVNSWLGYRRLVLARVRSKEALDVVCLCALLWLILECIVGYDFVDCMMVSWLGFDHS